MTDSNSTDRISANIPTLRNVAGQLASAAEDVGALLPHVKELQAKVRKEAAANTADGSPAPIFSPLLTALDTVCDKVHANIGQLQKNLAGDAAALKKQADNVEGTAHGSGQAIASITA